MRLFLAAVLTLSAAPVFAADIDCEGLFKQTATLADFEAAFGKENLVTGTVPGVHVGTGIKENGHAFERHSSLALSSIADDIGMQKHAVATVLTGASRNRDQ